MKSQIECWGKDAAVVIPSKLLVGAKVDVGSVVDVSGVDGNIVIQALDNIEKMFPFAEAELLRGLTPYMAHADELGDSHLIY
jgi:antitoxin component of MazEF toxin-antitoxin module